LTTVAEWREKQATQTKETIRAAQKKAEMLRWEAQRPEGFEAGSLEHHAQAVADLEKEKFALARHITEADSQIEGKF
jgi:hypothetical protein